MSGTPIIATIWSPRAVGIALAAYKPNPLWLAEQLASIVAQTHTEWNCVITLDSPLQDLVSRPELSEYFHDKRFTWVENPERLGVRLNFQRATALVLQQGPDLIAFCDQDDIWMPEKLAESIAAICSKGPLTAIYCDAYVLVNGITRAERLHEYTHKTTGKMTIAERIIQPQIHGFCMLFDAQLARLHPTIPSVFPNHDYWYSLVAACYGGVFRIDEPLASYRQHAGNEVGITSVRSAEGWEQAFALKRYSTLRENAKLRAQIARRVGVELPVSRTLRFLFTHTIGWAASLTAILVSRIYSDRGLASKAFRSLWGLLPTTAKPYQSLSKIRKYLPIDRKSMKALLAISMLCVSTCTVGLSVSLSLTVRSSIGVALTLLLIFSVLITGLRHLQHQLPVTSVLVAGASSLCGLMSLQLGAEAWLAIVVALLPIFANVSYQLRWSTRR